jgi:iron complex outermembrane receptor protein
MSRLKWAQLVLVVHTYAMAFAAHVYAADPQHIDILAGDLTTALESLARQSDIELVYRIEQLKGLRTRGVSGTLTSTQALTKLLEGTSLVIRTDASGAILISPGASSSGVPPSGGASPVSNTSSTSDANRLQQHLVLAKASDDSTNAASGREPAAIANADTGAGAHLEEIVVTAEKYETDVQKTAVSIAVLSGDEVARRGEQQLDQVLAMVGAVKVLQGQDGPTFYIRGVGTGVPSSIGDPEINLNVDGVYQSEPQFSRAGLYDVNRIEVLRGPQGTIYGRNAVAGVVNIVTNDPTFKYEASGSIGGGNYSLIQTQGALNVPLSETVAMRVAVGTENHDGYLSNGADDANVQSGRVKLLWRATDNLRVLLAADITHQGGEGEGEIQVSAPPGPPAGTAGHPPLVTTPAYPNGTYALGDVFNSANPWTSPDPGTATRRADFWSVRAQIDWDMDFGALTVIPAYRRYTYQCLNCWRSETDQNNFASERQATVEARLASKPNAPVTWLAGVYYLDANNPSFGDQLGIGADSFANAAGNQVNEFGQTAFASKSYAAFGQVTYPLTPWFRLTGGARYTDDKKSETGFISSEVDGVTTVTTGDFGTSKSWNSWTYTAGVEADAAANSMVYAKVSTGYKAGGFYQGAAPDSYNPEHLKSYEIGSKNRFLGNRLEINVDAFYYNYHDYQVNYLGFINPTSAGIFGVLTQNAQGATIYGADIETRYLVTSSDQFDLSIYPLHARFGSMVIPGFFGGDYSRNVLPFAPRLSGNLGFQHSWGLPPGGGLTARIETHLETDTWVTFQESPGTREPGHSVSNAYLTYNAAGDRWSAAAYVRNLENRAVLANGQGGPVGLIAADIAPPRTYGVQLTGRF